MLDVIILMWTNTRGTRPSNKPPVAPRKAQSVGNRRESMKFTSVTQWVRIPPVQSLANRTVANSAGQPGNGSPKPGGARVQAAELSPEMSIVVDTRITTDRKGSSQRRRRQWSGRQQSEARKGEHHGFHRGRRAGQALTGGTWERGRARCLLVTDAGRAGVPADQEPWRRQPASGCQRTAQRDTNGGSGQGIGKRATSEATREGQRAVVAEHSTAEGGEVKPKRPTGGKAKPGRARGEEERREGPRAYQPSQQTPGHRRRAAQLCASGPSQLAGYSDRQRGQDTDEPDE